ncbi:hypothetical protein C8R44DRAFT_751069 [Mycena epipterygia]|nr:hypothetical protein C8R44DRAFT_751069 [Mycena epipterygia]
MAASSPSFASACIRLSMMPPKRTSERVKKTRTKYTKDSAYRKFPAAPVTVKLAILGGLKSIRFAFSFDQEWSPEFSATLRPQRHRSTPSVVDLGSVNQTLGGKKNPQEMGYMEWNTVHTIPDGELGQLTENGQYLFLQAVSRESEYTNRFKSIFYPRKHI